MRKAAADDEIAPKVGTAPSTTDPGPRIMAGRKRGDA